jgi:hypothetical protein
MRGKHFLLVDGYAGAASKLEYMDTPGIYMYGNIALSYEKLQPQTIRLNEIKRHIGTDKLQSTNSSIRNHSI